MVRQSRRDAPQPANMPLAQPQRRAEQYLQPAPEIKPRGVGGAVADTVLGLGQGAVGLVKGVADNWNAGDNPVSETLGKSVQGLEYLKSDELRNTLIQRDGVIQQARRNGGELAAARAALNTLFASPQAAGDVAAQGAGSLLPIVGMAALRPAAMWATNALANAGSSASQTADALRRLPPSDWQNDTQYLALVRGGATHDEAVATLAPIYALPSQGIGFLTGALSGRTGVERALAGRAAGSTLRARAGSAGAELAGEQAETLAPQIAGNLAVGGVDQRTGVTEGLGQAAVDTAAGSAPGAGLAAALPRQAQEAPQPSAEQMARDRGFLAQVPATTDARVQRLRDAGDTQAADLLQRRVDKQNIEQEFGRLPTELTAVPQFEQHYRRLRETGSKTVDASARASVLADFEQAAQEAGLSQKAVTAVIEASGKRDLADLPGFLDRYTRSLATHGMAQPVDLQERLATALDAGITAAEPLLQPAQGEANSAPVLPAKDVRQTMQDVEALEAQQAVPTDPAEPAATDFETGNDIAVTPETEAVHAAATSPLNDLPEPTQAQKEAGNYKVGRTRIAGLDISIENPQGSTRRGTDPEGNPWETPMRHHYGYIRGTAAADGDKLDVFVVPGTPEDYRGPVFVVDQIDPSTGRFDEHKVVLGARDEADAEAIYRSNYTADWQGMAAITRLPMGAFRAWAKNGNTKEPLGDIETSRQQAPQAQEAAPAPAAPDQAPVAAGRAAGQQPGAVQPDRADADWGAADEPAAVAADRRAAGRGPDRRQDADQRRRVQDMDAEEMRRALLTHELTGIQNRRAWEDAEKKANIASIDADSLKWLNDNMSPEDGDSLLREVAYALSAHLPEADIFHISGDEFIAMADDLGELQQAMARVQEMLDNAIITREKPDGTVITKTGLSITTGYGKDKTDADQELKREKRDREARGERAGRGETPPGVVRRQPAGVPAEPGAGRQSDGDRGSTARPRSAVGAPTGPLAGQARDAALTQTPADAGVSVSGDKTARAAVDGVPKITDFGEKIGGARKDVWTSYRDSLSEVADGDIASQPFSKVWPLPDYQALIDAGADPWAVAFTRANRDEIPTKPRQSWKVKRWVQQVQLLRDVSRKILDGAIDPATAKLRLNQAAESMPSLRGVNDRVELYQLVGHTKSLAGVRVSVGEYSVYKGVTYNPPRTFWTVEKDAAATAFSNWPRELAIGDTREKALDDFKAKFADMELSAPASREVTFDIFSRRDKPGYWIGKKIGRNPALLKGPFDSVREARAYKADHQDELLQALEKVKDVPSERRTSNDPRVGEDMRDGRDATPEMFSETFGFRGVEFGNYVEQKKRQQDLNDAFDALMDMSAIIGVPPRALSLNGELGLAFGARGTGGKGAAAAHYERDFVVINMTKRAGAGSLGHEWWHALDNYFSRMRGARNDFLTEAQDAAQASRGQEFRGATAVRKEMVQAFGEVMRAIRSTAMKARSSTLDDRRTKAYWTTGREMSARAFESYLISKLQDQGASNDYLANIVDEDTWKAASSLGFELDDSYPYPTAGEVPAIRAGFDNFFQTVQTRETEKGVAMFARGLTTDAFRRAFAPPVAMTLQQARKVVDEITANWPEGPTFTVVSSAADLPFSAPPGTRGEVRGNGRGYIVAGSHLNREDLVRTLGHEAIGHYGMWKMLGTDGRKRFEKNMQLALAAGNVPLNAIRERVRRIYVDSDGKFNLTPEQEANEIAAFAVEDSINPATGEFRTGFGWLKQFWTRIRAFLRDVLGLKGFQFTDADLQVMLLDSMRGLQAGQRLDGGGEVLVAAARDDRPVQLPDAVVGHALGAATGHKDYAAAKAGDVPAAVRLAKDLVTHDLVARVRKEIGDAKPLILPVISEEAAGRNKIPLATAQVLGDKLGLETVSDVVQANRPHRTGMDGLDRLFAVPEFDGAIEPGRDYLLVDDTLTQGATFAALASHIQQGGGRVVGAVALTGKQYSAKIEASDKTLQQLRAKHGDLEDDFRAATGYGFDALTQSEARYLANYEPAQRLRDRIAAEGRRARDAGDQQAPGGVDSALARGAAPAAAPPAPPAPPTQPTAAAPAASNVWNVPDTGRVDRAIYELQDGRIDLKRVQEAITKTAGQITEQWDARLAETLYPGRVANRSKTFLDAEVAPLLKSMAVNQVSMDELADYLHARGAEERNVQIAKVNPDMPDGGAGTNTKGELMTTAAAKAYLAAISPMRTKVLEAVAKRVDAITAGTRKMLVAEGLETQDTIDAWEKAYKNYVPMFRDEAESGGPPAHPQGSGFAVRGSASRRATGSTKAVTNMLAHVLMQREAAITRAEKNRVALALYGLALSNPNPKFWTTIKPGMSPAKIEAELQGMGVNPATAMLGMERAPTIRTVDEATGTVVDRPNPMYRNLPGAIPLKVNGEDRVLMLNTGDERGARLAESLKNLDGLTKLDIAGSVVGKATRWLASVNTQYNPAFGLVNVTRDVLGAAVNLGSTELRGSAMKALGNTPAAAQGIARALATENGGGAWGDLYRQFVADGGQTGYKDNWRDPNERAKAIEKELKAAQKAGTLTPGKAAHAVLDLLDGFNTTLENAVRVSAYKAGLDKGMSRAQAARLARELTVDFNRKGRLGREVGPLYAFFNASVQGTARTLQTLRGPTGAKVIAGGLALGVLQALLLAAAGYDEDELREFEKARGLFIPLPGEGKKHIIIPLPLGLHVLPNTGRVLAELVLHGGKKGGARAASAVAEILAAFNPLGGGDVRTAHGLLTTAAPTVVDPLVEIATNTNFAGYNIERRKFSENDNRPGAARVKASTADTMTGQAYIGISEAINAATGGSPYEAGMASPTPEMVRHLAQTIGGGVLREIEKGINFAAAASAGKETKMRQVPVLSRFFGEVDEDQVETSRFFENKNMIKKAESSFKAAIKAGDEAAARRILDETPGLALGSAMGKAQDALTELDRQSMADKTPEEIEATEVQRVALLRLLNGAVLDAEGDQAPATLAKRVREAVAPADR